MKFASPPKYNARSEENYEFTLCYREINRHCASENIDLTDSRNL